jgi:hypothetical protein
MPSMDSIKTPATIINTSFKRGERDERKKEDAKNLGWIVWSGDGKSGVENSSSPSFTAKPQQQHPPPDSSTHDWTLRRLMASWC